MYIYPYRNGSKSVKALRQAIDCKIIRRENSKLKPNDDNFIINWGSSSNPPQLQKGYVLNSPERVEIGVNKLQFFRKTFGENLSVPNFTTDSPVALDWIRKGKIVVVREILTGHSGQGIVLLNNESDWDEYDHKKAKLYVEYIPKKHEYRVHVVRDKVVDIRRKAMNPEHDGHYNHQIRNHHNGFIYVIDIGHEVNQKVYDLAVKIISSLGLDFGAVDIIWNDYRKEAYALEVNCAPGLEGQTVDSYANAFKEIYREFKDD